MYSYLKSTGYSFASDHYGTGTVDDGLLTFYTTRTYKRIFAKCMDSLRVPDEMAESMILLHLTKRKT